MVRENDEDFDKLINDLRCACFHMNDEEAKSIVDEFINKNPELLKFHNKEWYYKNC